MVDPILATGAVVAATVAIAAGYSYLTGNESSVDVDDDGNDEVTFEGDTSSFAISEAGGTSLDETEDVSLPLAVTSKDDLTNIRGIGNTRAQDLHENGFPTVEDVYHASDEELLSISGIGDLTVSQIRSDIGSADE